MSITLAPIISLNMTKPYKPPSSTGRQINGPSYKISLLLAAYEPATSRIKAAVFSMEFGLVSEVVACLYLIVGAALVGNENVVMLF